MNDVRLSLLDQIEIASPCSARWEDMEGDDRQRLCADCNLNVYNIAAMTRDEAESLICETQGRLCAQIYRRADGTILTSDCPVGLARIRQQALRAGGRAIAAVVFVVIACISTLLGSERFDRVCRLSQREPFQALRTKINPPTAVAIRGGAMGGMIAGRVAMPIPGAGAGVGVGNPGVECETEGEK